MPVAAAAFSREKLLQVARALPADLHVLSQLGEILQDVNSELDQIAGLLRRDVALAARIVRISNSPVFGGGGDIATVEDAVNRVGFSEILKLVGTATAARLSERALEHYSVPAQRLRDNILYTALAAEAIARAAGLDARTAYAAGLMRPLGLMVLDRAGRGQVAWMERYSTSRWPNYSLWEGTVFGIDHCEVAAVILAEWRFPKELVAGVRLQYLRRAEDRGNAFAAVLNLAGELARQAGHALDGEIDWWSAADANLRAVGVTAEEMSEAAFAAQSGFEAALAALAH